MGRDKARLRLGNANLLHHVVAAARPIGAPVRIIRRDTVPRCGPMGGVFTALSTTRSDTVLFLACDMPMVSSELLRWLIEKAPCAPDGWFVRSSSQIGFPFLLPRRILPIVTCHLDQKKFSLYALAQRLKSKIVLVPRRFALELINVNTPADLAKLTRLRFQRGRPLFKSKRSPSTKM